MKMNELLALLKEGQKPIVTFKPGIEDVEGYPEVGMRAQLVGCPEVNTSDNTLKLTFDFSAFDDFNRPFESANYYGSNRQPNLTAREAGYYSEQESFYFMLDEDVEHNFVLDDTESLRLYAEYRKSGFSGTYVQWLEQIVRIHWAG